MKTTISEISRVYQIDEDEIISFIKKYKKNFSSDILKTKILTMRQALIATIGIRMGFSFRGGAEVFEKLKNIGKCK